VGEQEEADLARRVSRFNLLPRATLRDLMVRSEPKFRRAAGTLASTMSAIQATATARLLPHRDGEALTQPMVEGATLDLHAIQFRAERPPRDLEHAELVARDWEQQWGISIDDDNLTLAVSVVPAQRLREEAQLFAQRPTLERVLATLDAIRGTGAQDAVDPRLARIGRDLRSLIDDLSCLDARTAAERQTRVWWSDQRARAADVARAWCIARRPRPSDGLWRTIVSLLWYHGWDIDPARHKDVARLKTAWTTWRQKAVAASASSGGNPAPGGRSGPRPPRGRRSRVSNRRRT
jgi:hypothetical protein